MSAEREVHERARPRFRGLSLGVYFLTGFAIVGIVLFAAFEMTVGRRIERRIVQARVVQLRNIARVTARVISQYLDERSRSIEQAAFLVGRSGQATDAGIATALADAHRLHPPFLTMLVADARGDVLAVSPPFDANRRPYVARSHNVADRDYFRVTRQRGSTFVSGVFRGRGLGTDPIIAIAAPLPLPGGTGIIEGSLDLDMFGETIRVYRTFAGVQSLIVDPNGRVVYSSGASVPVLTPLASTDLAPVIDMPSGSGPRTLPESRDLVTQAPAANGYRVLVRASRSSIDTEIGAEVRAFRGVLALLLAGAVLFAYLIARHVAVRLRQLAVTTGSYLRSATTVPDRLRTSRLSEIRFLADNFTRTFQQLDRAFNEMDEVIHRQEELIDQRTVELREANERLRQLATTDELTGLVNFREFSRLLDTSIRVAARDRVSIALLMIDVDHFKKYNDTYGHAAGNETLIRIGRVIASHARRALDVAARYGGEEFALILFSVDDAFVSRTAEELRRDVESLKIPHRNSPAGVVTASIGGCSVHPSQATTPERLIHLADEALYVAKRTRNAIHVIPAGRESMGTQ